MAKAKATDEQELPLTEPIPEDGALPEPKEEQPTPEEVVEKMKADMAAQAEELRVLRESQARLEKERGEAVQGQATAQQTAIAAHERALTQNIETLQGNLSGIERDLQEAYDTGNSKLIVELNRKLAVESVKLANTEGQKQQFDQWKENEIRKPKETPVDRATQDWIAAHPRFNTDPDYKSEAIGAHTIAINKGINPGTSAYFKFVEDRLARAFREDDDDEPAPRERAKPMPSAPPSRESGTAAGIKNKGGRELTARQIEAAETCGMSPGEYRKYLDQCEKEGLLK